MTKSIDWYSPTNIKSYNKSLNFIIGGRGIGKTYGFKKDCISRYKKSGELNQEVITQIHTEYLNDKIN